MHTESETINPSKAPPHPNPYNLDTLPEFTKFLSNQLIKTRKETAFIGISLPCCTSIAAAAYVAVNAPFWYSIPFLLLALILMPQYSV